MLSESLADAVREANVSAQFLTFLCVLLMLLLFKKAPKYTGAAVLASVAEHSKAVMCLMEEIHVLDELCSGVSDSTVGQEFSVNKPTVYSK